MFGIFGHNCFSNTQNLKRTSPAIVNATLCTNLLKWKSTLPLFTEVADNFTAVFFFFREFEMSFKYLSEDHLNSSDHAAPTVVAFDFFDAFSICEPEGVPEYK